MISYIIFLVGMLQSPHQYEHFDLTWNINIAQSILANPDTIKVTWRDTTVWNSKHLYSKQESFYKKEIQYIKDNFSDQKDISIIKMDVLPTIDDEDKLLGFTSNISFINSKNNKTIKFLFIEKEKGKWRIYTIMTDDDKDPFR